MVAMMLLRGTNHDNEDQRDNPDNDEGDDDWRWGLTMKINMMKVKELLMIAIFGIDIVGLSS